MRTIFIFILLIFISCEKEIELKLDKGQDKLVVNSLFYPDTNFRVYVTTTKLINENKNTFVNDAVVKLYKNDVYLETLNFEGDGWYTSVAKPEYDTRYKIEVLQGEKYVFAESSIPDTAIFLGEYTIKNTCEGSYLTSNTTYKLTIIHDNSKERFYQTMEGTFFQTEEDYRNISDPSILSDSEIEYNPKSLFFSNKLFESDTAIIHISKSTITDFGIDCNIIIGVPYSNFYVQTKNLSKEYYLFLKTWVKHKYNQNSDTNIEEPIKLIFQGQPIEMYSNVVGGYGVFAGFNKQQVEFIYVP